MAIIKIKVIKGSDTILFIIVTAVILIINFVILVAIYEGLGT